MHSEKKITKEDTWRSSDLRKHMRERDLSGDHTRSKDEKERRHRGGESTERRHRDPDATKRDKRDNEDRKEKHVERRKESFHTQRTEKEKRQEWDSDKIRMVDDYLEDREKRREREERYERRRERERQKEKEKPREKEDDIEKDRNKRREDREKERVRKENDREHRSERRKHGDSVERRRDHKEQHHEDEKERDRRHRTHHQDPKKDKDSQERHRERKHSERKEGRDHKEEHIRHEEEKEHKHKDRGHHDEMLKHKSKSSEHHKVKDLGEIRFIESESQSLFLEREREKYREIRKKEEAEIRHGEKKNRDRDFEKSHRDRTSSMRHSSAGSHKHEKKEAVTKEDGTKTRPWRADRGDSKERGAAIEELVQEEYEDDFEDYEEDFEDMDECVNKSDDEKEVENEESRKIATKQKREIEAIQRAMDEENERAETALSRRSISREEEETQRSATVPKSSEKNDESLPRHGKFIDFVAAQQREVNQKVASKQRKRYNDLLRLIDLDFSVTFCLLDLPPVTEYDLYIKSFGNPNTKQAYTQCNEDNTDRDIQTDEIEIREKWTQHPPDYNGACQDPNISHKPQRVITNDGDYNSQRLSSFLHSASQIMIALLEENRDATESLKKSKVQQDSLPFADRNIQLNTKMSFLHGRQTSLVHFSQDQKNIMLSVHKPIAKPSAVRLDGTTILCVWNIWEPFRPKYILTYESEVISCCFSRGKAMLVFAGTLVGSVVLWDLREDASMHYHLKIGENEWILRQPAFSTDGVMAASAHFSPVTTVEVVPSPSAGEKKTEVLPHEERVSFHLASLDENRVLNIWVVMEISKFPEASFITDLGLRPGSKVKLLHSSTLVTAQRSSTRDVEKTWQPQTLLLKCHPTNSNHFFVGTNMGLVSLETSYGLKQPPKFYKFQEGIERPVDVNSIHFSPFKLHLFLVGCGDGSIRLHTITKEYPVMEWRSSTSGNSVVSLQWSLTRPAVFCVLDAASNIYIWDLLKNDAQPVVTERIDADRVGAMAVFGNSGQYNVYSGIALALDSGKIELRYFSKSFTTSSPEDDEKLETLIAEAL